MKKTMKWITLSLSAVALLGLTACGAKPAPAPTATPESTQAPAVQPAELDDLEGILSAMEAVTKATIAYLTSESERLKAEIGGDYQTYKAKQKDINRWLELVDTETASYVQRTQEGCKRYFTLLPDKVEHSYDAMDDAVDEVYDRIYDDARDDYYDAVFEDLLEDFYDDYFSDLLEDAFDVAPYQEVYELRSDFYDRWYDTRSSVYDRLYEAGVTLYDQCYELRMAAYDDNYNFAQILADLEKQKATESAESAAEQDKPESSAEPAAEEEPLDESRIRPEFKEAMDSCEQFYDEYVAFMQKYQENPGDLTLLADYASYITRYEEMMNKLDAIEEDDLTTAELAYYIEVTSRIQQKLLTIAA